MAMAGVMTRFVIKELSGVDEPAQAGARVAILKRDFTADQRREMAESGAAMENGAFPIADRGDLEDAIKDVPRADDPAKARAHVIARAKALDAEDLLPDDWKTAADDDLDDEDEGDDEPNSAIAMAKRGAAILKAGDIDAPRRPTLEPGERVNWPATKEANLAQLDTLAKKRAKADGCTFEAAYSKILAENPHVYGRFR